MAHRANAQRLSEERRADPGSFLEAYLVEHGPAFRPRLIPSLPEAIDAIHAAGGLAVWAHPFWGGATAEQVLKTIADFRDCGVDGIECFYPTHTRQQTELLYDRCAKLGWLATGSSDFHGPEHPLFSRFCAFATYGRPPLLGPLA